MYSDILHVMPSPLCLTHLTVVKPQENPLREGIAITVPIFGMRKTEAQGGCVIA